jgi:L-2-hydroxyglutarate oxidase
MIYDMTIIGGGIVGLSSAYQLIEARPDLKICVLEKESDVAQHQSQRNSGVMHSGIYYKPGSVRARNCREGLARLGPFCDEHEIPYEVCGKLIVATREEEISTLNSVFEKGLKNGLRDIKIISGAEAREIEPHIACVQAIRVPEAGIVQYERVAKKYRELFEKKGGTVLLNHEALAISPQASTLTVETTAGDIETRYLIACGGLFADRLAKHSFERLDYQVLPFRGEYYELKKEKEYLVNHLIYPVPDVNFPFLGVHYTRMITGGIEAGPNAVLAFKREGYRNTEISGKDISEILAYEGFRKLAAKFWRTGLGEIRRSFSKKLFVQALQKLIPEIAMDDVVPARSGVRAMACDRDGNLIDDFLFLESDRVIHVISAPSPAATASLAIGREIVERALKKMG